MHQAYEKISCTEYLYGCFISGPSKTTDIAHALVMGAQAARDETIWATQKAMAVLFEVGVPAISKHLKKIASYCIDAVDLLVSDLVAKNKSKDSRQ